MNRRTAGRILPLLAATVSFAVGCPPQTGGVAQGKITGSVIKGPVSGASVTAFAVDDNGRRAAELGTAEADEAGAFSLTVGPHSGPTLVCATGGIYTEEATGGLVQLGTNELCSLIDDHTLGGTSNVILTPLTNLHASLTACFKTAARDPSVLAASGHAALRLNDFFAAAVPGYDLRTTLPIDPTTTPAASLTAEAWAGILLAGLSESAKAYAIASGLDPGVRVTAATLSTALAQDIDDGACLFDGQTATARLVQGTIELTEDALRGSPQGLATSILRFLESERNVSGIAQDNVRDLVQRMQAHTSEIFGGGGGGADIDAPSVVYSEPDAGSTRGGNVRVTVRATDVSRIAEFAFTQPAQATFTSSVFVCTDDSNTDCTLTGTINTSAAPVVDGPLTVTTRATDAAGNSITQDLAFIVNNTLPQITVSVPQSANPPQKVDGIVEIVASAADSDGISTLTVNIPGLGLCDDQPTSPCRDIEPATDQLRVRWDTTATPEGNITLTFEAVDGAGQRDFKTVTVEVDNSDIGAVTGVVDLGAPVRGANVAAVVWTGRQRGAVLGTAVTNDQGQYRVNLDDSPHGSVLVVVTGGSYTDLATALPLDLGVADELTAAAGAIQAGEVRNVNVNAWTTLAASRGLHTPNVSDDAFVIQTNNTLLSRHLRRPPGAVFDISRVASADLTAGPVTIANATAVLALSHAGLSRFAAEASIRSNNAVGTITMTDIVTVLAQDLRVDPLLDGQGPGGATLTFGPALEPVTSFTTRFDLAGAIDRWLAEQPLTGANVDRNNSGINRTNALNALLFRDIAEDDDRELYPEDEPARPFDVVPPTVTMAFQNSGFGQPFGAALSGTVVVEGRATDAESSVIDAFATLDGVTPLVDEVTSASVFRVSAPTSVPPNVTTAISTCADAAPSDLTAAAALASGVCFCGVAEDENFNVGQTIFCFTRPLPAVNVATPTPETVVNATSSTLFQATVTSGFDLASCNASLVNNSNPMAPRPSLNPFVRSGPTCTLNDVLSPGSFTDGTWTLQVVAEDIAGRATNETASFVVDTTPPTVAVTSPTESNSLTFTVRGTVSGTNDVASVTVSFSNGAFSAGAPIVVPLQRNATSWQTAVSLSPNVIDGDIQITAQAADINGNTSQDTLVMLLDRVAPTLVIPSQQPAVLDYDADQPVTLSGALNCPPSGPCVDRRPLVIQSGARQIPSSTLFVASGNPSEPIVRWATMLNDPKDVPSLDVELNDENPNEVLYELGLTCTDTPSLGKAPLFSSPNRYRLPLTQDVSSISLASQTGAVNLCLSIVGSDEAGNQTTRQVRFLRWRTIGSPATVTNAPTSFTVTGRTYPGGFKDAQTFAGRQLFDWAAGQTSYVIYHAFFHNPHAETIRVAPTFAGLSNMTMTAFVRQEDNWSSVTNGLRVNGSPLRNPCNTNRRATFDLSTSPVYDDSLGCGTADVSPANIDFFTSYTDRGSFIEVDLGRRQTNAPLTPPTTAPSTNRTEQLRSVVPNAAPVVYQLNGALEPTLQLIADSNQSYFLAPGQTVLVVMLASNTNANINSNFIEILDDTDRAWDIGAPGVRDVTASTANTLPRKSPTTNVLISEPFGQSLGFNRVQVFAKNTSGAINLVSDLPCDAGECALGTVTNEVLNLTVNRTGTPTMSQTTIVGSTQSQWTSAIASPSLPSRLRCVPGLDASPGC
jgi:hypothetical protein